VSYSILYPISRILDYLLEIEKRTKERHEENEDASTKNEIRIIKGVDDVLTKDEIQIIKRAFDFSNKNV